MGVGKELVWSKECLTAAELGTAYFSLKEEWN